MEIWSSRKTLGEKMKITKMAAINTSQGQAQQTQPTQANPTQPTQPAQTNPTQLTPEENQTLMSIRNRLISVAPEIGDIMANARSKAILFAVLEALGSVNPTQLKTILNKVQPTQ